MSDNPKLADPDLRMAPERFYGKVGECITRWAEVEHILFDVFHAAVGCKKAQAGILFGFFQTFSARLKMTDLLVLNTLPKPQRKNGGHHHPDVKEWSDTVKRIGGLLTIRNIIAHKPVVELVPEGLIDERIATLKVGESLFVSSAISDIEMSFSSTFFDPDQFGGKKSTCFLKISDLESHLEAVTACWVLLKKSRSKVRSAKRQLKPSRQQAAR